MGTTNRPVTVENLANDLGHYCELSLALESILPGRIDSTFLAELEGIRNNRMALELLTNALNGLQQGQQQQPPRR